MSRDVKLNLLPSQAKFQAAKMKMVALSRRVLTIVGVLWLGLAVVIMLGWQGTKWWLVGEQGKYQRALRAYLSMSETVAVSQLVKYRAKTLGEVLASRFEYSTAFSRVGNLFGPEVTVRNFQLKEQSKFVMTIATTSGETVDLIEEKIAEINKGGVAGIKGVNLVSAVYLRSKAEWQLNLEVLLK